MVNYLDSGGLQITYWLQPIDEWLEQDGISMDRYPEAFKKSAMFKGETFRIPIARSSPVDVLSQGSFHQTWNQ